MEQMTMQKQPPSTSPKKKRRLKVVLIVLACVAVLLLIGWNILKTVVLNMYEDTLRAEPPSPELISAMDASLVEVGAFTLPPGVQIVALGEATHGNAETFTVRRALLERLALEYGCRAFALEEDFATCWAVNRYVVDGEGTAKEAAKSLNFWLYHNQDMVDLLTWMHDFNTTQPNEDKIHFYGFDIQNTNKELLAVLQYLESANSPEAETYMNRIQDIAFAQEIEKLLEDNREALVSATGEEAYLLARQAITCVLQQIGREGIEDRWAIRDAAMADNVSWILEFEKRRGRDMVLISGHNGHTVRTSGYVGWEHGEPYTMGSHLATRYGGGYYNIGMDIYDNTFLANQGRVTYQQLNEASSLIRAFAATERDTAILPLSLTLEQPQLKGLLTVQQQIAYGSDGAPPSSMVRFGKRVRLFYGLDLTPAEDFDAIVYLHTATPPRQYE